MSQSGFWTKNISILAGQLNFNSPGSTNGIGSMASFSGPAAITIDSSGNLYVADQSNQLIRKITPAGMVSTLAGTKGVAGSNDGTGTTATFSYSAGLAVDSSGNVFVADSYTNIIRKITPDGVVTTFAGSGDAGATNGTGIAASFNSPNGLAIDSLGNIFVEDASNFLIRKITPAGIVTTFAGSGSQGSTNGTGVGASFDDIRGMTIDSSNNLYVTEYSLNLIRKITPAGVVTTFAGSGASGYTNGTSTSASFNAPMGICADSSGNLYVTEINNNLIRKITSAGVVSTFAGTGSTNSIDGISTAASFYYPMGIVNDASGNLYVADASNNLIRKITSAGVVTTIAGKAPILSKDGTGMAASFNNPNGIASDSLGTLYVTDTGSNVIRKITSAGVVTTFAGSGIRGSTNGTGSSASFDYPYGIVVDTSGNIFVSERNNQIIRKITSVGVVSTFAGSGTIGSANGTGTAASFNYPLGLAIDSASNIYVADGFNNVIRKITSAGVVSTFAGSGSVGSANATGTSATFNYPYSLTADSVGNVYVADSGNNMIRKITPSRVVTTFAGSVNPGSNDGTGAGASFFHPIGIVADTSGNIFVSDLFNYNIRKITSAGVVTTLAGSSNSNGWVDGTGANASFNGGISGTTIDPSGNLYVTQNTVGLIRKITSAGVVTTFAGTITSGATNAIGNAATFSQPQGLAVDSTGNIFVSDYSNNLIRKITSTGVVTTFAGSVSQGTINGTGIAASFCRPNGLTLDGSGNIYVADYYNHLIRKITPAGVVTTLAGSGSAGSANGTGAAASFHYPSSVGVDSSNNVYVTDSFNNLIRKITPAGAVSTFAGSGIAGSANGNGTAASFNSPYGITLDTSGNVYVADMSNNLIRKITQAGTVTTFAGSGALGFNNGTGTSASFNSPNSVTIDTLGNLYVADTGNFLIRKITSAGAVSTIIGAAGQSGNRLGTAPSILSLNVALAVGKGKLYFTNDNAILQCQLP